MSPLVVFVVASIALIISLLLAYIVKVAVSSFQSRVSILESQLKVNDLLVNELKLTLEKHQGAAKNKASIQDDKLVENEQVIKQLNYRIQTLQTSFSELQEQFKHAIEQQPEDKLYSRAFKLAEKGADLEEIIKECELPHAEAEMLLSLYKAKANG